MSPRHSWFPGYTVAATATVAYIATAPGQTFVVSQLNGPLRETFGIGELALNSSYAVATVLASIPLVLVGRWTDRVGPRFALAGAAFAFGLACLVMSAATGFLGVVVGFFLVRFLGQGALGMVSQHAIAMWFHRRLGTIHGIKGVVIFGVWTLFPQAALYLIQNVGWRWTYVLFAGLIWVSVIPLALLTVRDRPEDLGLRMDDDPAAEPEPEPGTGPEDVRQDAEGVGFTLRQALRTRAYWIIAAASFLTPLIGTAILFDIQPIMALRGMDVQVAAFAVSSWTATMAIAAIPAGHVTDRFRPMLLIPAGMAAIAAGSGVLWWAPHPMAAAASMVFLAAGQTTVQTCTTVATARYFGRTHHGAIRSSLMRIAVIGTGLGPIVTGLSANRTGGYGAAMTGFAGLCLIVLLLGLGLRAPSAPAAEAA